MRYHRIFGQLIGKPLFCDPAVALTIYNVLAGRFGTASVELPEMENRDRIIGAAKREGKVDSSQFLGDHVRSDDQSKFPRVEPFRLTENGVALMTVDGEMVNRGAWVGADSGLVSYEGVGFQLTRAAKSSKTKAIILDTNTPGGEGVGMEELASLVRQIAAEKPVFGIANGIAASAGYGMLSGSTRIFNTPSGVLGSIGCILMHMDMTQAAEAEGIVPTLIYAGDQKAVGHPLKSLTEQDQAELQGVVNKFYDGFTATVAAGRGRKLSQKAAKETQARTYIGKDAVGAGLADDVGTFLDILAEVDAKVAKQSRASSKTATRNQAMDLGNELEGTSPEAIAARETAARAKGGEEAVKAYQARLAAIIAHASCKGKTEYAMQLANKHPSMSVEDVAELVSVYQAPGSQEPQGDARKDLQQRADKTGVNDVGAGGKADPASRDEKLSDRWDKLAEKTNKDRTKAFKR